MKILSKAYQIVAARLQEMVSLQAPEGGSTMKASTYTVNLNMVLSISDLLIHSTNACGSQHYKSVDLYVA